MLTHGESKKKVRLTEKETSILKYLYRSGDAVVGREKLLGEVWGYNAGVTTHTLETHVYRLRQKIEEDPSAAAILVPEPCGYRLIPCASAFWCASPRVTMPRRRDDQPRPTV